MPIGLLGKKLGMTQVFHEDGTARVVTVMEAGPCMVTQVKTVAKDGYEAVQLSFGEKRKLIIPSHLGYGDKGKPGKIPGGATLYFDIELLGIKDGPQVVNVFKEIDTSGDLQLSKDEVKSYLVKQVSI